jgi:phospholipase/carboxylesterase
VPGIPAAPARGGQLPIRPRARIRAAWCTSLLLASCATPPAPARGLIFPSQYLEAILTPPAGYDSTRTYPLLVALHGYGDTAAGFARAFGGAAWARCFVAVPEAEYSLANGGTSWFYLTRERSLWEAADRRVVAAVVGLIDALRARYPLGEVYVLGFSQGAALAYQVGLLQPSLVSGIVAISGQAPPIDTVGAIVHAADLENASRVRIFVARGRDDASVPRRTYLDQADLFTSRGFAVTRYEFDGGHDLPADVMGRIARWLREAPR